MKVEREITGDREIQPESGVAGWRNELLAKMKWKSCVEAYDFAT